MAEVNEIWHAGVDLMLRCSHIDARRDAVRMLLDELVRLPSNEAIGRGVRIMHATFEDSWPKIPRVLDGSGDAP